MLLITILLGASGCRVASPRALRLPTEGPTFVVECNYEFANCRRYAEEHCPGRRMEEITRKNCPRCGKVVPANPQSNARIQSPGYHGTLYYRCM